jgi:uncharacterized membrane protein (UPF0127 family)
LTYATILVGENVKLNIKKLDFSIYECKTFFSRLIGFMFKIKKIDYGLYFKNCNSIHTFFMFQRIDVVMVDKFNQIVYLKENVPPFSLIKTKKEAKDTYEFPVKTIKKYNLKV